MKTKKGSRTLKTLSVDFDGVLHCYSSGWKDDVADIPDLPVEGAIEWLRAAAERYVVCIFSARSYSPDGRSAMKAWLHRYGLDEETMKRLNFPESKPPAWLTIDDRAFRFAGRFPSFDEIDDFRPWYKPQVSAPIREKYIEELFGVPRTSYIADRDALVEDLQDVFPPISLDRADAEQLVAAVTRLRRALIDAYAEVDRLGGDAYGMLLR